MGNPHNFQVVAIVAFLQISCLFCFIPALKNLSLVFMICKDLQPTFSSLQYRRILGGWNLVRVRNIVVAAILWFYDSGRLGSVEIVTLTVGARAKEGKGGGGGKAFFSFSLPAPSPLPLTRPISSSLREVSTWRFREQIARSKKTPALQANIQGHDRQPVCVRSILDARDFSCAVSGFGQFLIVTLV